MPTPPELSSRIALPAREQLSAEAQRIHDSILATRGNLEGPFLAWLHCPQLADPAEKLGAFCRFHTGLSTLESELLILVVAAHYRCSGEWQIHAPIAVKAGLTQAAADSLSHGQRPSLPTERLQKIHAFADALMRTARIGPTQFDAVKQLLGDAGTVALVGLLGYYSLVAMTLNAFEMRFPARPDPFALAAAASNED